MYKNNKVIRRYSEPLN